MALLDKLRQEFDRAGRSAQRAFDEGRIRLDLYRARQSVDRFAQRFGYAVFRAKQSGAELPVEEYTAHINDLTAAEGEVKRLETLLAEAGKADTPPDSADSNSASGSPPSEPRSDSNAPE